MSVLSYGFQAALDAQAAGEHARSRPHLDAILALDPEHQKARFALGFALQKVGRTDAAIEVYRAYLDRTPDHTQIWFKLAYALFGQDRWPEAMEAFRETLRLRPSYVADRELLTNCEAHP